VKGKSDSGERVSIQGNYVVVGFRLPKLQKVKLDMAAQVFGTSVNDILRNIVASFFDGEKPLLEPDDRQAVNQLALAAYDLQTRTTEKA